MINKYLSNVRREKHAFEKLIHERANVVIPIDHDESLLNPDELFLEQLDTRIAGGQVKVSKVKW